MTNQTIGSNSISMKPHEGMVEGGRVVGCFWIPPRPRPGLSEPYHIKGARDTAVTAVCFWLFKLT